VVLYANANKLMDFVKGKGNPYVIKAPGFKLQNLVRKQIVDQEAVVRLLKLKETSEALEKEFNRKRFIEQKQK